MSSSTTEASKAKRVNDAVNIAAALVIENQASAKVAMIASQEAGRKGWLLEESRYAIQALCYYYAAEGILQAFPDELEESTDPALLEFIVNFSHELWS